MISSSYLFDIPFFLKWNGRFSPKKGLGIYQWRNRTGRLIPKGRAAEAAYRTGGKLVFHPDLYEKRSDASVKLKPQE